MSDLHSLVMTLDHAHHTSQRAPSTPCQVSNLHYFTGYFVYPLHHFPEHVSSFHLPFWKLGAIHAFATQLVSNWAGPFFLLP